MNKLTHRIITFLTITFLCGGLLINKQHIANGEPTEKRQHTIAGYGPVYGELFSPKSMQIFGDKVYVIDEFGVSSFDLKTKEFIKRFPVDLGRENPENGMESEELMDESQTWIDWLQNPGSSNFLRRIVPFGSGNVYPSVFDSRAHKIDLNMDSKGLIYLLGMKGIQVYDPESGNIQNTFPIPVIEPINDSRTEINMYSMKVYQDKIYILQSFVVKKDKRNKSTIQVFSLDGQLEKVIPIAYETSKALIGPYDFTYLPDLKLFAFWNMQYPRKPATEGLNPVFLYDENGQEVKVFWNNDHSTARILEYQPPNRLILWCDQEVVTTKYNMNTDGRVEFTFESKIELDDYVFLSDIATSENALGVISNDFTEGLWEYKVLLIKDKKQYRFGDSPDKEGQVFATTAFAADQKGNLYQSNILASNVQCFSSNGEIAPIRNAGKHDWDFSFREFSIDDNQNLYGITTNVLGYSIKNYNISKNSWESININFEEEEEKYHQHVWYNIEISENNLYILDSKKIENKGPSLFMLIPKITTYNTSYDPVPIELSNPTPINQSYPPFFIGFHLTEDEYQFLDCANQEILIYSRSFENYKNKIRLPKNKNSFYSSFDLYPDGTFLVTDAIQNNFLHLSKTGEVLETFGESGAIAIGTTKEAYQSDPNKFNGLFRAKIANGYIYANDLFNYRFHIFPIPSRPSIEWSNKDIKLDKVSIFEDTKVEFNFKETTAQSIPFILSSTTPWVKIQNQNGNTAEEKIVFSVLGKNLLPWDFNAGKIDVTFPDYPELNTELRILIDYAVGNIVKVTIDSDKATVNDKEIILDKASIPLLKNGRTFVGIRFMGEIVFSNTAKISYDSKSQTVFFELGTKKIELYIGKPYALVNGTKVNLDVPPFIQAGRTFIPLRFVSESLDASVGNVEYDAGTKSTTITITYPKKG